MNKNLKTRNLYKGDLSKYIINNITKGGKDGYGWF